jgi:hypothetical protein
MIAEKAEKSGETQRRGMEEEKRNGKEWTKK